MRDSSARSEDDTATGAAESGKDDADKGREGREERSARFKSKEREAIFREAIFREAIVDDDAGESSWTESIAPTISSGGRDVADDEWDVGGATSAGDEAISRLVEDAAELGSESPLLWIFGAFGNSAKIASRKSAKRSLDLPDLKSAKRSLRPLDLKSAERSFVCDHCGRRWDGFAQCFPCYSKDDDDLFA